MSEQQKTKEKWVAEGIKLYVNKHFEQALAACEQALLLDRNYARALHGKGLALMALGRYEEALAPLQCSIRFEDPSRQEHGEHDARRLQALGEAYQQLIKSQPHYCEHYTRQTESFIDTIQTAVNRRIEPCSTDACFSSVGRKREIDPYASLSSSMSSDSREINSKSNALVAYERLLLFNPESDLIHIEIGGLLFSLGNYKKAGEAFNRAIIINPKHKEEYARRTQELLERKDFLRYEEMTWKPFSDALQFNPSSGQVQVARGKGLFQQEKYAEAGEMFKQAIQLDVQYQQLYDDLYVSLLNKGQEARNPHWSPHYYRSAIAFYPQKTQAYADLGKFLYESQSYKEAGHAYRQGCKLDPALLHIYKDRTQALLTLSEKYPGLQRSKVFDVVKAACQFDPAHPLPHLYYGRLLLKEEAYEQAGVEYRQAIELDPVLEQEYQEHLQRFDEKIDALLVRQHYAQVKQTCNQLLQFDPQSTHWHNKVKGYIDQGEVHIKQDHWQEALNAFERALLFTENDPNLFTRLGETLLQLERYGEASEAYEHAISLNGKYRQTYIDQKNRLLCKANEQYQTGHKLEACDTYQKVTIFYPGSADAYAHYGKTLYELQKYTEAGSAYNRAIYLSAEKQQEYKELMELLLNKVEDLSRSKSYEEALKMYENATSFNPKHVQARPNLFIRLGETLLQLERYGEAGEAYKHAISLNGKYRQTYIDQKNHLLHKASEQYQTGHKLEACDTYQKATIFYPLSADANAHYGKTLYELQRYPEAGKAYKHAIYLSAEKQQEYEELMALLLNKGEELGRNKSYEEALKIYEDATSFNPDHSQAQLKYADLLYESGRFEEAGKLYKSLVKIDKNAISIFKRHSNELKENGKELLLRKQHNDALLFFENAICFDPTDRDAYLLKSDVLGKLGRYQEAFGVRQKIDAISDNSGTINEYKGKREWLSEEPFRYD